MDAEDSNLSGNINLRNGPWLNFFSGRKGPIVPEEPTGSWTQWFNMDTPVSADQEHEGFTDEVVATLLRVRTKNFLCQYYFFCVLVAVHNLV